MRRWQYLLFSTALAVIVLSVGTGSYLAIVRQERLEEIRQIEEENERLTKKARQAQEQIRIMDERLTELEEMLLNLQQTEQIVSGASPSRGRRQYTVTTMPILSPSGFSPARFERAFKGTGMAGLGQAIYGAEKAYGVNAVVLAAICAHESGWGTSRLAREKNNLAGLGAYSAGLGMTFESRADCIDYLARLLAGKPGTLTEVGAWYASDPRWAAKVAGCMKAISEERR